MLAALLTGVAALCGTASAQDTAPTGTELLRRFLDDTRTLKAEFRQELIGAEREILETAAGSLAIRRPGRFAWRYTEPIEQLVIADGKNLWIYDADLEQATVAPLEDATPASPALLLSGEASLDTEFDVLEEFATDGTTWVRLAPRPSGTDFKEVRVGFRDGLISALVLLDSLDQTTVLEFSRVQIGVDLPDDEFEFVLPPGANLIGEAG